MRRCSSPSTMSIGFFLECSSHETSSNLSAPPHCSLPGKKPTMQLIQSSSRIIYSFSIYFRFRVGWSFIVPLVNCDIFCLETLLAESTLIQSRLHVGMVLDIWSLSELFTCSFTWLDLHVWSDFFLFFILKLMKLLQRLLVRTKTVTRPAGIRTTISESRIWKANW